jgi:D-3-phosphoglycerate dehydrogenase
MSKFKAIVTDYIEKDLDHEAKTLAGLGIDFQALQLKFRPEDEVYEAIKDADVIVVNMVKMPESLISRLTKCKLIIRHGIGYDNVDVKACTKYGIQFAYQPDYCKEDVAEHAISLIFACARRIVRSRKTLEQSSASGQWDFSGLFPFYRLDGKTLGILGCGRIGSRVFRKLRTFGFRIISCDPYLDADARRALEEQGLTFVDKETLFRESDFLTVHTPLNDETRKIVNAETLALMKPTAYLVNTARGPMVDTPALAAALKSGKLAGAAIDVFEKEPPEPDFELFAIESAILTPHTGWASVEAEQEIRDSILNDIIAASQGKSARCVVNSIKEFKK